MGTLYVLISCLLLMKTATGSQWTLHGSSPVAVVGTDFVLTCTVPPEDAKPGILSWKRTQGENLRNQVIITSSCTVDGQILWSDITFTCNDKVFTLTIPGKDIDANNDNNVGWKCENAGGSGKSNVLTLTVLDPVVFIQMNGTNPLVVYDGGTISILCKTSPSRPAANVLWYKDSNNITSEASTVVEKQPGDKYITKSYLTLTGRRADDSKTIRCEAFNGPADKVTNKTVLDVWYPPPNVQVLSGYNSGDVLYVGNSNNITCKQEGGKPFSNLTLTCNGKTGTIKSSSTGSLVELAFTVDRTYNGKTCTCVSTNVVNNYRKVVDVVLTVHYAPNSSTQITGYSNGTALNDGSTINITCTQKGGFPMSDITWDCMGHSPVATNKERQQSTSSVSFAVDRTYNQMMCTCTATHPDPKVNYAWSKSVVFTVSYVPLSGNGPTILGYVNGTTVFENHTDVKELTCGQGDCNPLCTLTWDCQGLTWTNHNTQTEAVSVIKVPMLRMYNGKTCRCAASHISIAYTDYTSVVFTIYYPPDITIIYSNNTYNQTFSKIICAANGNPDNYTYYAWKHKTELGQYVRSFVGKSTSNTSTLTIPDLGDNLNYQNNGYYVCTASNGISDKNGQTNVSKEIYFDVAAPPVIKMIAFKITEEPHSNVSITIPFYSNPVYTSVKWSRNKEIDVFNMSGDRFVQTVTDAVISLPFHDRNIMFKGKNATLLIQNIQKTEFTNYTLRVKNSVGEANYKVGVQPVGPPNQPHGIAAVCTSINTAEIIWISKFNGGDDQHFFVGAKTTENEKYTMQKKLTDPGENEIMREVVDGLEDGTKYFFTVYAKNNYGQSMPANNLECVTPAKDGPNTASVVLFVLSTVFPFFVITGISIICFLRRKRKTPHKRAQQDEIKKEKDMDSTNAYQDLGKREQSVDAQYQELENLNEDSASANKRNVYQELGAREKQSDDHYQQLESTYTGTKPKSKKGNVYDTLEERNPPNVYEEINTKKTK